MFQPPSRAGTKLAGKYQLEQRIGIGGISEIYRARNVALDRVVAIKMLLPDCAIHLTVREKFLKDAQTATMVRHKNVTDIYDIEHDEQGIPFIIQEFLSGLTLADHMDQKGGHLEPREALDLLLPIAEALAEVHARGLLHRDVKPTNVLLAQMHGSTVPKLVDFGSNTEEKRGTLRSTAVGSEQGTPAYMSPDQIRDAANVGPGTDVWSFGVTLFEVLAGALPFAGTNAGALAVNIATAEMRPILDFVPSLSSELAQVIAICLRKVPSDRYPSARELHAALAQASKRLPTEMVTSTRRAVSAVANTEVGMPVMNLATGTAGAPDAPAIRKIATQTGAGVGSTLVDGSRGSVARSTFVGNEVPAPSAPANFAKSTLLFGGGVSADARAPDAGRSTRHGIGGPMPPIAASPPEYAAAPPAAEARKSNAIPVAIPDFGEPTGFDDVTSAYDMKTVEDLGLAPIPDLAKPSHVTKRATHVDSFEPTRGLSNPSDNAETKLTKIETLTKPATHDADAGKLPPSLELDLPTKGSSKMKAAAAKVEAPPATARKPPTPPHQEDDDDIDFGDSFQFGFGQTAESSHETTSARMRANIPFDTGPKSQRSSQHDIGTLGRANMHVIPGTHKGEGAWVNVAGPVAHVLIWLGVIFGLMRTIYNPDGYSILSLFPAAFDGTSMVASGVTALVTLALCIAFGIGTFRGGRRTYGLLVSALGGMLIGMAMITVTLSSSGDLAAPPDGSILIPYLVPLLTVGMSIGLMEWAFWQWRSGIDARRTLSLLCATASGVLAFCTVELSPLARLFGG